MHRTTTLEKTHTACCTHSHQDSCTCGHTHACSETISQSQNCLDTCLFADHPPLQQEGQQPPTSPPAFGSMRQTYRLENLSCAHCAAKIEEQIAALPGITCCSIVFATQQLRITAENPDSYLAQMQVICTAIEPDVQIHSQTASTTPRHSHESSSLLSLVLGGVLFAAGEVTQRLVPAFAPFVFTAADLVLGSKILVRAGRNLIKGKIFDENFLMSIATLGAFVLQDFAEGVGVMLFYRIGEYFEHRAVERSRREIMAVVDLRPQVVSLVSGDTVQLIPPEEAQVGDILLVRPGDRIPLDGVVVDGESRLDTSPVTGEPVPVKVSPGSSVLSGCLNTTGVLKIRAEKVLAHSMVTRILDSVENAATLKPKMDRFITRFARIYTPFVLALALCVAVIPSLFTGNWQYWIYTALTFLVISCPCALVLSVPLAFFSGIGAGSKKGILLKGGVTLESLNRIRAVVMDKTGTITKGNFALQQLLPVPSWQPDALLAIAAACEQHSTHPIAVSILEAAKEQGVSPEQPQQVEELPSKGVVAQLAGQQVLCGNRELLQSRGVAVPQLPQADTFTQVLVAVDSVYAGALLIADTVKEEAVSAVAAIEGLGIATAMLTGDAPGRAQAVAQQTGINEVHAGLLPQDKVEKLRAIRSQHGPVLFVGDGINDAPVLAAADVSAAMGSGADAAIEVADLVFMTSSLSAIPQAFSIAKATGRIAIQNVAFALAVKGIMMALGLMGFASMWMAVFADSGVSLLCVLNSIRVLYRKDS